MIDATGQERLLKSLVRVSSAGKQSNQLARFFGDLGPPGWYVELSRIYLRLCTNVSLSHAEFAAALGFSGARAYRLALIREDEVLSRLLGAARAALRQSGGYAVTQLQRTAEYHQLQRALQWSYAFGANRLGRRIGETFYAVDAAGSRLEQIRVSAGLRLKEFAARIGTSENTYRRRLSEADVPTEWLTSGQTILDAKQREALASNSAPLLAAGEFAAAIATTWTAYEKSMNTLRGRTAMGATTPNVAAIAGAPIEYDLDERALESFIPSDESAPEGLDLDLANDDDDLKEPV